VTKAAQFTESTAVNKAAKVTDVTKMNEVTAVTQETEVTEETEVPEMAEGTKVSEVSTRMGALPKGRRFMNARMNLRADRMPLIIFIDLVKVIGAHPQSCGANLKVIRGLLMMTPGMGMIMIEQVRTGAVVVRVLIGDTQTTIVPLTTIATTPIGGMKGMLRNGWTIRISMTSAAARTEELLTQKAEAKRRT